VPDSAINQGVNAEPQAVWFSCATAALIASLEAIGAIGKWIAVPPNVCPNVVAAIFGAGCKPFFVDIEPERQGMDPERLSDIIAQVGAVVAVHAYGTPCNIDRIMRIAGQTGVAVIEDCAQADGATFSGREVGTFGDIAVFSFGKGKIIEAGGGGLAIVNNMCWAKNLENIAGQWEPGPEPDASSTLSNAFRTFYNDSYPGRTQLGQEPFFALMQELAPLFRARCIPDRIARLAEARGHRDALVLARRQKYRWYVEHLADLVHCVPIPLLDGAAPWRFNALIREEQRDTVFRSLLASGISASSWYPRISEFLPDRALLSTELPVARHFERGLLNLWVDDSTDFQQISQVCSRLKQELLVRSI